jgi:hypothetical protein
MPLTPLLALSASLLASPALAVDGHGGAKWGQSVKEVKATMPDLRTCSESFTLETFCRETTISGKKGQAVYYFEEGALRKARLTFDPSTSDWSLTIIKLMEKKYGPYDLTKGPVTVSATWVTEGVELTFEMTPAGGMTVIKYGQKAKATTQADLDAL